MLDKKFKAKWIRALRSGKFKKGVGFLQVPDTDKYCCLGVACKVSGIDKIPCQFQLIPISTSGDFFKKVPKALTDDFELQEQLACMNDSLGGKRYSFKKIADWIKKHT